MRTVSFLTLLSVGADLVYGQVAGYYQCGGIGYTGETTCVAGFYCFDQNPWYYQCIPGTPSLVSSSTSTTVVSSSSWTATAASSITIAVSSPSAITSSTSTIANSSSTSTISTSQTSSTPTTLSTIPTTSLTTKTKTSTKASSTATLSCKTAFNSTFHTISASAAFAALNPGWNLGNTLDAIPTEGSWNNPPVQASTFADIHAEGFKSVRIPVTWAYHFIDASPTWDIDPTWMDRVETVVDEALAVGLYVIVNAHHDSWIWADVTAAGANYSMIEEKFGRLWSQIGTRLACKSQKLLFEPLNEPTGTTQAHADELNKLNGIFLQEINDAGGYNPRRVVSLSGLGMDSVKTSQWFVRPTTYPSQPWGLQFHYYSPYDFIFSAWAKTIWGSDSDKASLLNDFTLFEGNFTGIPTFIGEWDSSSASTEKAARWKYFDYFIRTCSAFNYSSIIWDNGLDQYNRSSNTWYDPIDYSILMDAVAGKISSLADSTTDPSATSQNSSAYLFHHIGDPVIAQSVPYLLNGNKLRSIKNSAGATVKVSQYSIDGTGSLTFTAAYLSTLYSSTSAPGIIDTLTLTFTAGTKLTLEIVQYDTPVIPTSTYVVDPSADLYIPVTYKGLPEVAAVTAVLADGTYLQDTWTVYLGPLQHAGWTFGNWGWDSGHFIVYESGLSTIQAAGETVTLTVEFFPRSLGQNSVNVTFTQS